MPARPDDWMERQELRLSGLPLVSSYGRDGFTVLDRRLRPPLLLLPDRPLEIAAATLADLDAVRLAPLLEAEPAIDILLLGGGERLQFPPDPLARLLREAGIAVEPMDSGAAVRTFNVLLLESRRVSAVLMPF